MLRLVSDENFHGDIVRGLRRRLPALDLVRVQDAGLSGIDDPGLLAWASAQNRILLTHDRTTMPLYVVERLRDGLRLAGVFIVDDHASLGRMIDELLWPSNAVNNLSGRKWSSTSPCGRNESIVGNRTAFQSLCFKIGSPPELDLTKPSYGVASA